MKVHNLLEEEIINRVENLYTQVQEMKTQWMDCSCKHCRLDTVAYVLNKLPAQYIVSGNGVTHAALNLESQLLADMDFLIMKGMKKIASNTRSFHAQKDDKNEYTLQGPVFNVPVFLGFIYDGSSFEYLKNAIITLTHNNEAVEMFDYTWANPHTLNESTKGAYSFLVKPISAQKEDEHKEFHFTISVESKGYEKTTYVFDITLISDIHQKYVIDSALSVRIQDLYLFPITDA